MLHRADEVHSCASCAEGTALAPTYPRKSLFAFTDSWASTAYPAYLVCSLYTEYLLEKMDYRFFETVLHHFRDSK